MRFYWGNAGREFTLLLFLLSSSFSLLFSQEKEFLLPEFEQSEFIQDTVLTFGDVHLDDAYIKSAHLTNKQTPDTNFTFEKYRDFLIKISDSSRYVVLPLEDFRNTYDTNKIVIGLRHDVDADLDKSLSFSEVEKSLGIRSTYFFLHTADYYKINPDYKNIHNEDLIPKLKYLQDSNFEIGLHNDLVTLQIIYNIDPVDFLNSELKWLRDNGLKISGTASHGSKFCRDYFYLNYYFFKEYSIYPTGIYVNNNSIKIGSYIIPIKKGNLTDFGLEYEAYFLNYNKYYSDIEIINGRQWDVGMLDLRTLNPGDRIVILVHPEYWH